MCCSFCERTLDMWSNYHGRVCAGVLTAVSSVFSDVCSGVCTFTVGPPAPPHVDAWAVGGGAGPGRWAAGRHQSLLRRGIGQLMVSPPRGSSQWRSFVLWRAAHLRNQSEAQILLDSFGCFLSHFINIHNFRTCPELWLVSPVMHRRRRRGFEPTAVNQERGRSLSWPGGEVSGLSATGCPDNTRTHTHTHTHSCTSVNFPNSDFLIFYL